MTIEPTPDLYVYAIPPVDRWYGWVNLAKRQPDSIFPTDGAFRFSRDKDASAWRSEVDRLLYRGRQRAEEALGYQGDILRGPYLSQLPGAPDPLPIVAWVSEERELAFVASSVPLPHLDLLKDEALRIRQEPPKVKEFSAFGDLPFDAED